MIKSSCNNCRYAHVGEIDQNLQRQIACRRYPPAVYPHPQGLITLFPVVNADMHCGEFRPDGSETPVGVLV